MRRLAWRPLVFLDSAVTKDRLYRTLDQLLRAQEAIEHDLEKQLGTLFRLDYSLVLYDLTSTYFEDWRPKTSWPSEDTLAITVATASRLSWPWS